MQRPGSPQRRQHSYEHAHWRDGFVQHGRKYSCNGSHSFQLLLHLHTSTTCQPPPCKVHCLHLILLRVDTQASSVRNQDKRMRSCQSSSAWCPTHCAIDDCGPECCLSLVPALPLPLPLSLLSYELPVPAGSMQGWSLFPGSSSSVHATYSRQQDGGNILGHAPVAWLLPDLLNKSFS
jgi:hypothetical protein